MGNKSPFILDFYTRKRLLNYVNTVLGASRGCENLYELAAKDFSEYRMTDEELVPPQLDLNSLDFKRYLFIFHNTMMLSGKKR